MKKFLIIQTAFIGDVILATSLIETLHAAWENQCAIDVVVRKGNEGLLAGHPHVNEVLVWNKKEGKYKQLWALSKTIRKQRYTAVYNLQRFAATGFLTWRSRADRKVGYAKNPLAFTYTRKVVHKVGDGTHEIERNFELVAPDLEGKIKKELKPRLYPSENDRKEVDKWVNDTTSFVVMAPASVWFTKQLPESKWVDLLAQAVLPVYLIGAPGDVELIDRIIKTSGAQNAHNMAGKLSLLQSAELIRRAQMTYVNDSAPLHLASAVNAPVTAFFCSTVPQFGFGPLSDKKQLVETTEKLSCRPCGLHGFKACPEGHFKCGLKIYLPEPVK